MNKSSVEKVVKNGLLLLSEFFPQKNYLYFPLLSAFFVWALRSTKEWKEKIFSWRVWLEPGFVEAKPDEFVLDFFEREEALEKVYKEEIKKGELKALRKAFSRLYPILGLEDPFLSALFDHELESGDYKRIVKDFEDRVTKAQRDIETLKEEDRFFRELETLARKVYSLNLDLISQPNLRKIIADLIKKNIKNTNE
jgi:hypothetical protein